MKLTMLTTVDNPFSPFDQYPQWFAFDYAHGYQTVSLLARIAKVSEELSEADQQEAIDMAIDEIVRENVTGMFRRVTKEIEETFEIS